MRRVVVTGMGMLTPLGCGVETTWQRLLKGESGAKQIDTFNVSDISCKIACVIPRGDGSDGTYNPDQWMAPKEQRKVDDFIVYAMCAAKQALDDAGWRPQSYEDQTRTGVLIGSGIGGIEGIADGKNRFGGIVRNFAAELLLESHHELDGVETVGAKIVDETRLLGHLVGLYPQVLHDDLFHPLANITHRSNLVLFRLGCDRD